MEHLGIERAIVGGLSMGGGASLAFALKYPHKVRALILCDSAGTGVLGPAMQISREELERQTEAREHIVRTYGVVEQAYRSIAAGLARNPSSRTRRTTSLTICSEWPCSP